MFSGIVEEYATLVALVKDQENIHFTFKCSFVNELKIDQSISHNGVCLTVTSLTGGGFRADVMPETMRRSNLGTLKPGDRVNLERALCLSSRLGGHIVAGHVDGTGRITDIQRDDIAVWITISADAQLLRYMIEKGSITVDGVSLTIAYVDEAVFRVSVIPHTQEETTLTGKHTGDIVNLENDMIARYVEKLMGKENKGLSLEFLQANGF